MKFWKMVTIALLVAVIAFAFLFLIVRVVASELPVVMIGEVGENNVLPILINEQLISGIRSFNITLRLNSDSNITPELTNDNLPSGWDVRLDYYQELDICEVQIIGKGSTPLPNKPQTLFELCFPGFYGEMELKFLETLVNSQGVSNSGDEVLLFDILTNTGPFPGGSLFATWGKIKAGR